jgi:hypothetical protein
MDVRDFLVSLLDGLSGLEAVNKVDLNAEVFVLRGRVWIEGNRYVQVYFNEITGTTAFALIEKGQRIWGMDFDNMRGWHLHPFGIADEHERVNEMNIEEILEALSEVLKRLK